MSTGMCHLYVEIPYQTWTVTGKFNKALCLFNFIGGQVGATPFMSYESLRGLSVQLFTNSVFGMLCNIHTKANMKLLNP